MINLFSTAFLQTSSPPENILASNFIFTMHGLSTILGVDAELLLEKTISSTILNFERPSDDFVLHIPLVVDIYDQEVVTDGVIFTFSVLATISEINQSNSSVDNVFMDPFVNTVDRNLFLINLRKRAMNKSYSQEYSSITSISEVSVDESKPRLTLSPTKSPTSNPTHAPSEKGSTISPTIYPTISPTYKTHTSDVIVMSITLNGLDSPLQSTSEKNHLQKILFQSMLSHFQKKETSNLITVSRINLEIFMQQLTSFKVNQVRKLSLDDEPFNALKIFFYVQVTYRGLENDVSSDILDPEVFCSEPFSTSAGRNDFVTNLVNDDETKDKITGRFKVFQSVTDSSPLVGEVDVNVPTISPTADFPTTHPVNIPTKAPTGSPFAPSVKPTDGRSNIWYRSPTNTPTTTENMIHNSEATSSKNYKTMYLLIGIGLLGFLVLLGILFLVYNFKRKSKKTNKTSKMNVYLDKGIDM
mmetsp:Transcript_17704/g.24980  ORF Transcript_17704/g.24980 Transcript_17704/m.24980 type:complete len:471 (+) Transcript_17704:106-1518(+)|eukprot:CAMPEP_0184868416 /NCGR_PEP_ID=MMETSP0580-20130426/30307_1 /TAXON_ID=1118495 /ORGANISM="Dactyliosolen fragilissimus" /LENGTH=470 /DNA_ID=CAMNT_0027369279 /DNA_START=64 /DNA_END=1476 /DNA_ORIENTATION=-